MREVDHQIGDVYCNIIDAENSIIRMLEKNVLEKERGIVSIVKIIARLDCLLSLASAAQDFRFSRPQLFDENILIIEDGRHPLQEMCVSQFIPNDTTISGSRERVKLITGPNFSGKSVYLKQVGIIVFLAHIGSFVPAKFAQVGIFDKIFTRISSRETVSVGQSSFFLDCRQMANMINNSTEKSLLLVDEFGKGTNSIDGTAILASTLNDFLRKTRPPVLLVTTHCLDQKFFEFLDTSINQYQALHMSIHLVAENCERDTEEIVYLYKLVEGIASQSYGRHVAELAGVPITLLERADQVTKAIRAGEPVETVLQQRNEMEMYEKVISLFNSFDCDEGDLDQFLSDLRLISGAD
jgi:DNA mismatch repair protein MSH5